MSAATRVLAALVRAPEAVTDGVDVEHDIRLRAPDGVELLTDLYWPDLPERLPTILVRTPYGRRSSGGLLMPTLARAFAERGYRVVVQSTRGTFGSGGAMNFTKEPGDSRSAADWIVSQGWSNGEIGTYGPSYLSSVQWALASTRPPQLKAMVIHIMGSEGRRAMYPGGSFALDSSLTWGHLLANQERKGIGSVIALLGQRLALAPAFHHLPLVEADVVGTGQVVPFYRDWLEHDQPGDSYWGPLDFSAAIPDLRVPVCMVGGWYDYYLPYMIDDYQRLLQSGTEVQLTVGPWPHTNLAGMLAGFGEALSWFDFHLHGRTERRRSAPVRVHVMGGGGWRGLDRWPPPARLDRWYLHAAGQLALTAPSEAAEPDHYRYDPAKPTPAVGGPGLSAVNSGPRDNRRLERRPDVLTFTSEPLSEDLEVIGPVRVELFVSSSLEHTDFFARLCDVYPRGRSVNITDGLLRLRSGEPARAPDGTMRIEIELWPTACRFQRRHRVRLQVSSGAHPHYVRNLGTGGSLATGTVMKSADQSVYHDAAHPSALLLPIVGGEGAAAGR